jgi:hypothetical protein
VHVAKPYGLLLLTVSGVHQLPLAAEQSSPARCVLCWVRGAVLRDRPCQLLPCHLLLWLRLLWVLLLP